MSGGSVSSAPGSLSARHVGALIALLVFYLALVVYGSVNLSPAFDEPIHIRAGMTLMTRAKYVDTEQAWWTGFDPLTPPIDMLPAALARLNGESPDYRDDFATAFENVIAARAASHALGMLTIVLVFFWALKLWGPAGGLISAATLALMPLFIAHGTIVGTDLPSAFGGLIAAFAIWKVYLERTSPHEYRDAGYWIGCALAGLAVGFAAICKLSNLVFFFVLPAAAVWAAWRNASERRARARWLVSGAVACLVGFAFASAAYGYAGLELSPITLGGREIRLPFAHTLVRSAQRMLTLKSVRPPIYFFGEIQPASPKLYVAAFLLKTPPAVLVVLALGFIAAVRKPRPRGLMYVLLLTVGLGAFFATRGFYLGLRHMLLPIAFLAIVAGALARANWKALPSHRMKWITIALIAWAAVEVVVSAPWHLSYFNAFTFGRMAMVDSDRDWGQGLLALAEWQHDHSPDEPIWLAYFGNARPESFGVNYRGLLAPYSFQMRHADHARFRDPEQASGWVAISQTQLAGTYMHLIEESPDYYAKWRGIEPDFVVGETINIYDARRSSTRIP